MTPHHLVCAIQDRTSPVRLSDPASAAPERSPAPAGNQPWKRKYYANCCQIRGYGEDILAAVASITDNPVTTIINTHTHWDHRGANTEFPDTVDFVVHENTAGHMASTDCADGAGYQGGSIKNCEAFTGDYARFLPKITFANRTSLYSGADQMDLYYFGRGGHTDGDTWVVFREARAMHTGDMMARKGLPFIDADNTNGSATEFGQTLQNAVDAIENVDTIIPGHNDDPLTWDDLVDYAAFYDDLLTQAGAEAGQSVEETVAAYSVPEEYSDSRPRRTGWSR